MFYNFRSKTTYMRYITLDLDQKIFRDHRPLIHAIKHNLRIIL